MPVVQPQQMQDRRAPALLPLAVAAAAAAAALRAATSLAFAGLPGTTVLRPPAVSTATLRGRGVAVAARGGADDDDDFEFMGAADLTYEDLKVGQEMHGVVQRIANFGAFVDVGIDKWGLVPRSMLSDKFVESVEDVVSVGDGVTVWVTAKDNDKLTLSMSKNKAMAAKIPKSTVDVKEFAGADPEKWFDGTVSRIAGFGAFVAVPHPNDGEGTADGLVHISQLGRRVESVDDVLSVGQSIKVRVLNVDIEAGRMSLTMIDPSDDPALRKEKALETLSEVGADTWLSGKVDGIANFGVFVDVALPDKSDTFRGLVPLGEIRDGFVEDAGEEVEVGQEVQVRILTVDREAGRMSLSMKPLPMDGGSQEAVAAEEAA